MHTDRSGNNPDAMTNVLPTGNNILSVYMSFEIYKHLVKACQK
jgi:hypothetical protein